MIKMQVAVTVVLVSIIIGFATWAICQVDMAAVFFKMVCLPIILALFLARALWASFSNKGKDQAVVLAGILSQNTSKIESFTAEITDGTDIANEKDWEKFVYNDLAGPSHMARMVPTDVD